MNFFKYVWAACLCLGLAAPVAAQPALDIYYGMSVGTSFTLNNSVTLRRPDSLAFLDSIPRHNWAFTFPSNRQEALETFAYSSNMVSASRYPTAQFGVDNPGSRTLYFQNVGQDLCQTGDAISGAADVIYTPGMPLVPFGLTYQGPSRIARYRKTTDFGFFVFYKQYVDTLSYIGYGDLTLNGNFYPDAVLIRHGRLATDTTGAGPTRDKIFMWHIPGLAYPILELRGNTSGTAGVYFADQESLVLSTSPVKNQPLTLSPNPARQEVALQGAPVGTASVTLIGADGRTYTRAVTKGKFQVDGLSSGVYMLRVGTRKGRLVVE